MKTYLVRMTRRDGGWDAGIDGVGWIRVERLTGAERAVRAHLAVLGFGDATTARIELDHGPELGKRIEEVREARAAAEGWVKYAAERSRELASTLAADGLSGAEIAMLLGISPQRVSQLTGAPKKAKSKKKDVLTAVADPADTTPETASDRQESAVDIRTAEEKAAAKLLKKQRKAEKAQKKALKKALEAQKAS